MANAVDAFSLSERAGRVRVAAVAAEEAHRWSVAEQLWLTAGRLDDLAADRYLADLQLRCATFLGWVVAS